MYATRLAIVSLLGILLATSAGCLTSKLEPGVTFTLCALARENGSQLSQRGQVRTIESASIDDTEEVADGGSTITVQVRKTQYGKATFEVIFPDRASQLVQVKKGESKDILPRDGKLGVRIGVEEAR
jgi:hypothetical protein